MKHQHVVPAVLAAGAVVLVLAEHYFFGAAFLIAALILEI
jgi:hypothetical protein